MMGPDLLGRLMDEHAAALVLYARQWCSAPEDVVQEAFLKLVAQRAPPAQPVAWLYKVVRNAARDAARSARRRQRHESEAAARAPVWFLPMEGKDLDAAAATAALQTLPDEQRKTSNCKGQSRRRFRQWRQQKAVSLPARRRHPAYLAGVQAGAGELGLFPAVRLPPESRR